MNIDAITNILRAEYELGEYSPVCALLGVGHRYWTHSLVRIALSSVRCGALLRGVTELAGEVEVKDSAVLVHGVVTLPSVGKCTLTPGTWPCAASATVRVSGDNAYISTMGVTMSASCIEQDGVLNVNWPEELGLKGSLDLHDGDEAVLPILPEYPTEFVISLAKADDNVYNLLRDTGYSSAFFTERDVNEQLAILVLALYRHYLTNHGKQG